MLVEGKGEDATRPISAALAAAAMEAGIGGLGPFPMPCAGVAVPEECVVLVEGWGKDTWG